MSVFTILLVIFTGAMGIVTTTLLGLLIIANVFKVNYESAGRIAFVVSFVSIVALLALSGSAYAIVCTWLSGISLLIMGGFLLTLLWRSIDWK